MTYFNTKTNSAFDALFNAETTQPIEFNPKWNNGTGYLDNAILNKRHQAKFPDDVSPAPLLEVGEIRKCMTTNDRPVVIIGTSVGNVVLFRRFSMVEENDTVVCNLPRDLKKVIKPLEDYGFGGAQSVEKISHLLTSLETLDAWSHIVA